MATNPIIRTDFTFAELMEHWKCSKNDLRDAIVSQRLVPSIRIKGAVWELILDTSGKRIRITPAVYVNELMYLVGVERFGASDCAFNCYSRKPDELQAGSLFKADGNGYVDIRKRMSDVEINGRFLAKEVARSEGLYKTLAGAVSEQTTAVKGQWWNIEHNVLEIASGIKEEWKTQGREVIQSGSRHGKFGRLPVGDAVSKKITDAEKTIGSDRSVGGKTIANFLKTSGWN